MNYFAIQSLNRLRSAYVKIFHPNSIFLTNLFNYQPVVDASGQRASDMIKEKLSTDAPCMIARLGGVELWCMCVYYFNLKNANTSLIKKYWNYVTCKTPHFWWDESIKEMPNNAGFFPPTIDCFKRFYELMVKDMTEVDILGSCHGIESVFDHYLHSAVKIPLSDIEPYYHNNPWSEILKGKKVLVIHPFTDSIQMQYKKRDFLFNDLRILPQFNLLTLKSVQSIACNNVKFKNWFDALEYMKTEIEKRDFDIAIIGCGAYGFPLAAHVKRMGKKAVHLGGATQILFGIKGKRWESDPFFAKLMNDNWIRPQKYEIPEDSQKVEDGCYW